MEWLSGFKLSFLFYLKVVMYYLIWKPEMVQLCTIISCCKVRIISWTLVLCFLRCLLSTTVIAFLWVNILGQLDAVLEVDSGS